MVSSILTNNGAMTALQSLKSTQKNLLETQNRISTGLKIGTAKDNAATWAVATSMRSDIANFKQVSENLSTSSGVLSTAASGTQQVADLISKIRVQVTSAQDGVKDAKTIQANIDQLVAQVEGIVGSSSFKGVNLLDGSRSGSTQVLASVNSTGGALTPTYIDIAAQKLTSDEDGLLADLAKVSVSDRVAKFQYNKPTGMVDVGDTVEFTFKKGGVETKASFTATTTSADDLMRGLAAKINSVAGVGNTIARIDASGNMVVDAGAATDGITFSGKTALKATVDANNDIALGTATDLNPAKAKYAYAPVLNDTLSSSGGQTFEFSFKVGSTAKIASYTTVAGDDFAKVLGNLKDQINLQAGAGNAIASIDETTGKLVVDAAQASASVTFDGMHALKKLTNVQTDASLTTGADKMTYAAADITNLLAGDSLHFDFTYNGVAKQATVSFNTGTPETLVALAAAINTAAGDSPIAYVDDTSNPTMLIIDRNASKGELVLGKLSGTDSGGGAALSINAAGRDGVALSAASDPHALVYKVPADSTRIGRMTFNFTDSTGVAKTANLVQDAGEANKDFLIRFAGAINGQQPGADIAFINKDGNLVIDKHRDNDGSPATTFGVSGSTVAGGTVVSTDLLNTLYADYGDETALSSESSGSYSDLLASLQKVESAVLAAGAAFGAAQTRIDLQKDFMDKLVDTLTSGVGALVDADMSEEAARLQALQVQEQLGTQALSIANQAPQSILSLFRG